MESTCLDWVFCSGWASCTHKTNVEEPLFVMNQYFLHYARERLTHPTSRTCSLVSRLLIMRIVCLVVGLLVLSAQILASPISGMIKTDTHNSMYAHAEPMDDIVYRMVSEARAHDIPLGKDLHSLGQVQSDAWSWEWCDDVDAESYLVRVDSVELQPDPPVMGRNLTFHGAGSLSGRVAQGSYVDVNVYLGFLRLYAERMDLCDVLRENHVEVQCPMEPGQYNITHVIEMPKTRVPPIPFRFRVLGISQDKQTIACINGRITMHNAILSWGSYPMHLLRLIGHVIWSSFN